MNIRYSKSALKFLEKLDKKSVERIRDAIQGLTKTPPEGDIRGTSKNSSAAEQRIFSAPASV